MKNKLRGNEMKVAMVKQALDLHGPLARASLSNGTMMLKVFF
jgi:hypothetical protein